MRVTTLVSVKGAPGVTTLACLVGATWPDHRRVAVVEADPFGGDLAARFRLSGTSGWASFVVASRRSDGPVPITPHLQSLPGGLDVLVRPDGGRSVITHRSVDALLQSCRSGEPGPCDLVVDGGRLRDDYEQVGSCAEANDHEADASPWLVRSDAVFVVTRRDAPSIVKVSQRAPGLLDRCGDNVRLVVVGRGPHDAAAIEEFTGLPVLGEVPHDPSAAQVAAGEGGSGRRLSRSLLVVSARRLALAMAAAGAEATRAVASPGAEEPTGRVGDRRRPAALDRAFEIRRALRPSSLIRRDGRGTARTGPIADDPLDRVQGPEMLQTAGRAPGRVPVDGVRPEATS